MVNRQNKLKSKRQFMNISGKKHSNILKMLILKTEPSADLSILFFEFF